MSPRHFRALILAGALGSFACDPPRVGGPTASATQSGSTSASSGALPVDKTASALLSPPPVVALKRRTSPEQRFARDQSGCDGGDKASCRALADRFSGVGVLAGCGVRRDRHPLGLRRLPGDGESDHIAFEVAIAKACDLGDPDACARAAIAEETSGLGSTVRWTATRASLDTLGIWAFRSSLKSEWAKKLGDRRDGCFKSFTDCVAPDSTLLLREDAPKDGKLSPDLAKKAKDACEATHDCGEIYEVLDKDGYSVDELAPIRSRFAATLKEACLDGDCTCGEATRYLAPNDGERFDLAELGCENGEAEACSVLAEYYESGNRVEKDPDHARALYEMACPSMHPERGDPGDYAEHACDHLADVYMSRPYSIRDREIAMYYSNFACPSPGRMVDHAPCVRLGMLWVLKHNLRENAGTNKREAENAAMATHLPVSAVGLDLSELKGWTECDRPSVAAECAAFKKDLPNAR